MGLNRLAKGCTLAVAALLLGGTARAQVPVYDSGGPILPEQAAYDVTYYNLAVDVRPADSTVQGRVQVQADVVRPLEWFVLDLDLRFTVRSVAIVSDAGERQTRPFERRDGQIWIPFPYVKQPGERARLEVTYDGRPRLAPNPPWDGSFQWARTPQGAPWIATSGQ